ncbi:MAG: Rieske (2Fe-2S) protein [Planctomycetes bacterium]|nr:Rieske (2Fe-2S) protein [Planctomycetota bacterium]
MPEPFTNRRDFLNLALGAWAAAAAGGVAGVLGASALPVHEPPQTVKVQKSDLKDGIALAELGGSPVAVLVTPAGPVAFSLSCTHARCTVRWDPAARGFACPCHGGKFDAEGRVLAGPPPAPLRRLDLKDAGDAWEITG